MSVIYYSTVNSTLYVAYLLKLLVRTQKTSSIWGRTLIMVT